LVFVHEFLTKNKSSDQFFVSKKFARSPGEISFDRKFFPG